MGIEKIGSLSGKFIGTVINSYPDTREIDVYIPKLMPAVVPPSTKLFNLGTQTVITNCTNAKIDFQYNKNIKIGGYIRSRAKNADDKMPKPESKVEIFFLENDPTMCFWRKFNPNNDFEVIDSEKYDYINTVTVDNMKIDLYQSDNLEIELPVGYYATVIKDEENKKIKLNIISDGSIERRISELEIAVGRAASDKEDATGLHAGLESLKSNYETIEAWIETVKDKIERLIGKL